MDLKSIKENERRRTAARVRNDFGKAGYWGRKEEGKKDWAVYRRLGVLAEQKRARDGRIEEAAEKRRALAAYNAAVQRDIEGGAI